jgi:outer membrane lipoprotein-sorting protein
MSDMFRRSLLLAPLLLLPVAAEAQGVPAAQIRAAALSAQDRADVARIEAYLNSVRSLHARFFQVAPDGGTSQGQVWLVRPGRMRFQYDPPSPFLLVAGNGLLVFNDKQLNQTSNIPLGSTPLGLLLQDNLRLAGDVTIVSFVRAPGQLQVGIVRTASPQDGVLTLIFADNPLALRQWTVLDQQRHETRVTLTNPEFGGVYANSMFQFIDPRALENGSK